MNQKIYKLFLLLCFLIPANIAYATLYNFDVGTVGFTTFGTATSDSNSVLLTPSAAGQSGTIFLDTTLNASSFNASFDFFIDRTGPYSLYRGDGLTFAWVTSPGLGGGGGELGFTGLNGYMVEFDTYWNAGYDDAATHLSSDRTNHIAVGTAVSNPLSLADSIEMVNTGWNHVDIAFDNGAIQVSMNGTKYIDYLISGYTGFNAYFGFTGSTGASYSRQLIDNFEITAPVPVPSTILLFSLGLLGLVGVSRKKCIK